MSFANFKGTYFDTMIQTEAEKRTFLVDSCYQKIVGTAKAGERVKLVAFGRPTLFDVPDSGIYPDAENLSDTAVFLEINQNKGFNFKVKDIDKALATVGGELDEKIQGAAAAIAEERDSFVANLVANHPLASSSTKVSTAAVAKTLIDEALISLRGDHDVSATDEIFIEVPYFFYVKFKDYLIESDTNNSKLIRNGKPTFYDGCEVKYSNLLYNDGTDVYAMVRTRKAIAFKEALAETEAYRPDNGMSDAVKGENAYGGKIINPKQLYILKVHQ